MNVFFLSVFIVLISYIQLRKLFKEKRKKDAYVYIGLMIIAAYLSIGSLLEIYIPNPTNGLKLIFQPVQEWVNKLLS